MRHLLLPMTLCVSALTFAVQAQPLPPSPPFGIAPPVQRQPVQNPAVTLKEGMGKLAAFLAENQSSDQAVKQFLAEEIAPYFDFQIMTRMAAGPVLRHMGESNRAEYFAILKQDFLTTLAQRLSSFTDQQARIVNVRPARNQRAIVTAALANPQGFPARLDFRMRHGNDGWKIYDVVANGSSAVMYYRRMLVQRMRAARRGQIY